MCKLYAVTRTRAEIAQLARTMFDLNNNQPPMSRVYPDESAPVVLKDGEGRRVMRDVRWGMPSTSRILLEAAAKRAGKLRAKGARFDFDELLRLEPDKGTANVRNTTCPHWKRYVGPGHRCLAPFTAFSEPDRVGGSRRPIWFALNQQRPISFFAGIWKPDHTSVRKVEEGEQTCDLFALLNTDANGAMAAHRAPAMPVILTQPEEWDLWLSDAPWDEVKHLQRPLPDGALTVVDPGDDTGEADLKSRAA